MDPARREVDGSRAEDKHREPENDQGEDCKLSALGDLGKDREKERSLRWSDAAQVQAHAGDTTAALSRRHSGNLRAGEGEYLDDNTVDNEEAEDEEEETASQRRSSSSISARAAAYALVEGDDQEDDAEEFYPGDEYDPKEGKGRERQKRFQRFQSQSLSQSQTSQVPGAYHYTSGQGSALRPSSRLSTLHLSTGLPSPDLVESIQDFQVNEDETTDDIPSHGLDQQPANPIPPPVAEARPVDESQIPQTVATPFHPDDVPRFQKTPDSHPKFQLNPIILLIVVLLSLLLGFGFGFGVGRTHPLHPPARIQTPTVGPTITPTPAPTTGLELLLQTLPDYTQKALNSSSTPQWKAYRWLSEHPELPDMPEWRKRQLFALGVFYYAMEGPKWRKYIFDRWLQYTDECFWFNSEFGDFVGHGDDEKWVPDPLRQRTEPCNERGEIQSICVAQLQIVDEDPSVYPYIPREIALLTSLTLLGPCENDMKGDFNKIFPTELYSMTNLSRFNMINNQLSGTIPTELGLLTKLTFLNLQENALTGSLPTELLLLTNLQELYLYENFLTGSLAMELGRMKNLTLLHIFNNSLTGSIPEELAQGSNLKQLLLHSNQLTGTIPPFRSPNLTALSFGGNHFSGVIPEELCFLGPYIVENMTGLDFDCTDHLCGCDRCTCTTATTTSEEAGSHTGPFDP